MKLLNTIQFKDLKVEDTDKFAKRRRLPVTEKGDVLIIHDMGAHGIV